MGDPFFFADESQTKRQSILLPNSGRSHSDPEQERDSGDSEQGRLTRESPPLDTPDRSQRDLSLSRTCGQPVGSHLDFPDQNPRKNTDKSPRKIFRKIFK